MCRDAEDLAVDKLSNHSEHSQLWLVGPRDPMLENWPITGHLSVTSAALGPCSFNS